MTAKKKVLLFLQGGVGGAERMTVLIGKMLDTSKFDVKFCLVKQKRTSNSIASFIPKEYATLSITHKNPLITMARILWTISVERPDVVFSSVLFLNNKILPFRWMFPHTNFIIRCENYLYTFSKKQHWLIRRTYDKADAIIAQTKEMKDELVEQMHIDEHKIHALGNPIDIETIQAKLKDAKSPYPQNGMKHFVASGRFAYQKGFDILVEAFALVHKNNANTDLYIVGAKDQGHQAEYDRVWAIAEKLGIADDVHCVGFQTNPYPYIKYADSFVLSSRWEGLPNVLIEALYLGTPSAAAKCIPVIERIVEDGETGYLAESENYASLAEAMMKSINLGHVVSTYKSATAKEFTDLFNVVVNHGWFPLLGGGNHP